MTFYVFWVASHVFSNTAWSNCLVAMRDSSPR